jgi:nucleoid-associated protein YgaU
MALFGNKEGGSAVAAPSTQQLDTLKQKYQSVLNLVPKSGARLLNVHVEQGKLLIRAEAPSDQVKNQIWEQIKLTNPNWSTDLTADITVKPGQGGPQGAAAAPASARTYTVKSGDTLSKISKQFYNDPNQYTKIFEANKDKLTDPDEIKPGQVLTIPS